MEEKQSLQMQLEETVGSQWLYLHKNICAHKMATEEKRRIYSELLSRDKQGVAEVLENNKKITKILVRERFPF